MSEVASDLKEAFKMSRELSARRMAEEFAERYERRFIKAVEVFRRGIDDALVYIRFPGSHQNCG
jgi:transposase-like protein